MRYIIIVICFFILLTGCTQKNNIEDNNITDRTSSTQLNKQAISLAKSRKYEEAINMFEKALESEPDKKTILLNLKNTYAQYVVDLIKKKKFSLAEKILEKIRSKKEFRKDIYFNKYEALFYNDYAVYLTNKGEKIEAKYYYDKAIELEPYNNMLRINAANFYLDSATEYFNKKEYYQALNFINASLKLNENPTAYSYKGYIYYYLNDLEQAIKNLKIALKYNLNTQERNSIKKLLEKAQREFSIEKNFFQIQTAHFIIKSKKETINYSIDMLKTTLEDAYLRVGTDFNFYPSKPITVIIYSNEDYTKATLTPHWAMGLYDGKIRLPEKYLNLPKQLMPLVYHEYTHSVIGDITDNNCPVWLNEGLAVFEENKYFQTMKTRYIKDALKGNYYFKLKQLEKGFLNLSDSNRVALAYEQSFLLIEYINNMYGFWKIREILNKLNKRIAIDKIFEELFNYDLENFEQYYINYLMQKYR